MLWHLRKEQKEPRYSHTSPTLKGFYKKRVKQRMATESDKPI
jgi:hypothetical protein